MPPSAPSKVIKSGALSLPRRWISRHRSRIQSLPPSTTLNPVGLPVMSRTWLIISSKSLTERTSGWPLGLIESSPTGICRIAAISSPTLAPGRIPPFPGLAPWLSLISNIFTCGRCAISISLSSSSEPSSFRTPYFAVPI